MSSDESTATMAREGSITFGGNIIETGTTSYRLAHTLAQRAS